MSFSPVQSRSTSGTGALNLAFTSANTAKNSIVIVVIASAPGTVSVSDSLGNAYLPHHATFQNAAGTLTAQIYYVLSAKAGANTVTYDPGASTPSALAIHEFPPLVAADAFIAATGTTAAQDSGGVATAFPSELLFGVVAGTESLLGAAPAPGTGYAAAESILSAATTFLTEWQVVAGTGTYDATASVTLGKSGSFNWGAALATFQIAASGSNGAMMMMGAG